MTPWAPALGAGIAAAAGLCAYGVFDPNAPLFGPVIGRGASAPVPAGAGRGAPIYLTFDDGPNPTATERILDVLGSEGAPAAFFQVGRHVARYPAIARRVAECGQEIGNHTQSHRKLYAKGPRFIERELSEAHEAIVAATGAAPRSFRAPHGLRNPFVHAIARRMNYDVFGWTIGVWDTALPGAEEIRRRVRVRLRPGAIVLLHDGDGYDPAGDRTQTAAALPAILRDARDGGYALRPLSDLAPRALAEGAA